MNPIYIIAPIVFILVITTVMMLVMRKKVGGQHSEYVRRLNEALEIGGLAMVVGSAVELDDEIVLEEDKITMDVSNYNSTDYASYFAVPAKKIKISANYSFHSKGMSGTITEYSTQDKVSIEFTPELGKQYMIQMVDKIPKKEKVIAQSDVSTERFIKTLNKTLFIVCTEMYFKTK